MALTRAVCVTDTVGLKHVKVRNSKELPNTVKPKTNSGKPEHPILWSDIILPEDAVSSTSTDNFDRPLPRAINEDLMRVELRSDNKELIDATSGANAKRLRCVKLTAKRARSMRGHDLNDNDIFRRAISRAGKGMLERRSPQGGRTEPVLPRNCNNDETPKHP